jgi:predicted CXXCH cytochrome family protein
VTLNLHENDTLHLMVIRFLLNIPYCIKKDKNNGGSNMTWQFASKKIGFLFFLMGGVLVLFGLLAFLPDSEVHALTADAQFTDDCSECHKQAVNLLAEGAHAGTPLSCDTCHKLIPGEEGAQHPDLYYSTESEESTCATCHGDAYTQWYEGQHGFLEMTCSSCHEPHSVQQKLTEDNTLICENCHKNQVSAGHGSTHEAAGADCATCHIGNETGHGFGATLATCNACHEDIHEANQLVMSGFEFAPIPVEGSGESAAPEEESTSPEGEEAVESTDAEPARGGVNLPSWLLLVAGLLIGGGAVWVIIGKDPGTPTEEK